MSIFCYFWGGGWIFIILILVLPIVYFSSVFGYRGYTTKEYKNVTFGEFFTKTSRQTCV